MGLDQQLVNGQLDLSREHHDAFADQTAELDSQHSDTSRIFAMNPLLIDRQRVVHSAAFRRLQHKTQVFGAVESDHFRSRLTHTMEVAHWAVLLAGSLKLSTGLAEVAALAHDLGHPPFGHAGERALDSCVRSASSIDEVTSIVHPSTSGATIGFEHNAHTLRVVEYLEHPYPNFRGLNLTRAVRECLAKHSTRYDRPGAHPLRDGTPPPLESEVVDLADRLAYGLHDLQDGLYAGLIEPTTLAELTLWRESYSGSAADYSDWPSNLRPTIDSIQIRLLSGAIQATNLATPDENGERVRLDPESEKAVDALEFFLFEKLYRHPEIRSRDQRGREAITTLFERYSSDPALLPQRFRQRIKDQGIARVAADYIAGMTDRYCLEQAKTKHGA